MPFRHVPASVNTMQIAALRLLENAGHGARDEAWRFRMNGLADLR